MALFSSFELVFILSSYEDYPSKKGPAEVAAASTDSTNLPASSDTPVGDENLQDGVDAKREWGSFSFFSLIGQWLYIALLLILLLLLLLSCNSTNSLLITFSFFKTQNTCNVHVTKNNVSPVLHKTIMPKAYILRVHLRDWCNMHAHHFWWVWSLRFRR